MCEFFSNAEHLPPLMRSRNCMDDIRPACLRSARSGRTVVVVLMQKLDGWIEAKGGADERDREEYSG